MATIAQAPPAPRTVTLSELEAMPDDGGLFEVFGGRVFEVAPSSRDHSKAGVRFTGPMDRFATEHDLGEVYGADIGVLFRETPVLMMGPDATFVRKDRIPPDEGHRFLRAVPDLVVEVISPSDSRQAAEHKVFLYLTLGVPLVWLADPKARTVTVYRLGRDATTLGIEDALDGEDILPGFRLPLADIFR